MLSEDVSKECPLVYFFSSDKSNCKPGHRSEFKLQLGPFLPEPKNKLKLEL